MKTNASGPPTSAEPTKYELRIVAEPNKGLPEVSAVLGRVNVILGANGTGKSKLLRHVAVKAEGLLNSRRPVVYVEGGRVVAIPAKVEPSITEFQNYSTYEKAADAHARKRTKYLAPRVLDALLVLERYEKHQAFAHSEAAEFWNAGGQVGAFPKRPEFALARLFRQFHDIFPAITLELDGMNVLRARKPNSPYEASELSDGEKQVLAILADIGNLSKPNSIVIVDEPELNLHPSLAVRLWDTIESELPGALFIYATHSLGFSMRHSVECVLVLAGQGRAAVGIDAPHRLDTELLAPFLGAMPGILAANAALIVEGHDGSFDRIFYSWLLGDQSAEIIPLGGCNDVRAAATRTGVWTEMTSEVRLLGLVDRDFRTEDDLATLTKDGCTTLGLHEAESYLCDPALLQALAAKLGTVDQVPTREALEDLILERARESLATVAGQRASARLGIALNASVPRHLMARGGDEETVGNMLESAAKAEVEKATDKLAPATVKRVFAEEMRRCREAIEKTDLPAVLKLFPGKEILASLATKVGCKDALAVARAAKTHLNAADFQVLSALRGVLARLGSSTSSVGV